MEENEQQSGKEKEGTSIRTRTHIYTDSLYTSPVEPKKKSLHFLSHSLLIEIMYHDCSVIRFQWLAGPVSLCSI